jgi:two-component sensor histidine kinase
VRVATEIAVPLGLIANELMTNAFKHAFPGRRIGNLWLRLKRNGAQTLCFTVTDDGVGLPPEFHFDTTGSAGLYIVKNLVRQLRATLSFDEVPSGGASIAVCLNSPAHS